jgi:hypothetical protein
MLTEEEKLQYQKIDEEYAAKKAQRAAEAEQQIFSKADEEFIEKEQRLDEKYGDSPWQTFAESALSSVSFGLSDQVGKALGFQEALRERRERNETSALTGEVTGIVGPALLSGGSSLLAKGAGAAGKGIATAARAGSTIERLTAKGINKLLAETGKKKFARDVLSKSIAKGAGSAVEGTFYGIGELVEENALGNAEFNAENLMAYGGKGALWGGLVGGGLGGLGKTVSIVVPKIKGNKVVGTSIKKIDDFSDKMTNPVYNSFKLGGFKDETIERLIQRNPQMVENLPEVLGKVMRKNGTVKSLASNRSLLEASENYLDDLGEGIGKTVRDIDDAVLTPRDFPKIKDVASKQRKELEKLKQKYVDKNGNPIDVDAAKNVRRIEKEYEFAKKKGLDDKLLDETHYTAKDLHDLKKQFHEKSNYWKKKDLSIEDEISRAYSKAMRDSLQDFSYKLNTPLGNKLRQELLDYNSLATFVGGFSKRIKGQTNFPTKRDIFLGLSALGMGVDPFTAAGIAGAASAFVKSDLKNKLFVLSRIERSNQLVTKKIQRGVKKFFVSGIKRTAVPLSATILTKSPLAKERKDGIVVGKPKTEQEALKNVMSNLDYLRENPQNFDRIMLDPNLQSAAPKTYVKSKELAGRALMFLDRKMPRSMSKQLNVNPFLRKTFPSSDQEIYKFKKYLHAVQNPMSIVDDLERGALSTEAVEVMQFVYPELYSEVQSQVFNQLEKTGDKNEVEYPQRLQLGILMGMPTDMALLPQAIKGLQALYKEAQASQAGGSITAAAANKLDLAESQATELEKVSNRKDLNRA